MISGLFSLKELDLSWNNFCSLPYSLSQLSNLKNLYLRECMYLKSLPELPCNLKSLWLFCCTSLQSLPQLPRSLEILIANDCTSLKQIPNLKGLESLQSLSLESCSRLAEIQGLENLSSFHWMDLDGCSNLETTFVHRLIKVGLLVGCSFFFKRLYSLIVSHITSLCNSYTLNFAQALIYICQGWRFQIASNIRKQGHQSHLICHT